jgi:hypothetical protein
VDEHTLETAVEELSLLFFGGDAPEDALLAQRLLSADELLAAYLLARPTILH